ncbi:trypsin-like peptidase domain-containing protein [Magnetovibrio sp. PR-2]|uniref:S1C family serine protease n=1 Tax=Magnetovibrio sp. PR-2 TaxID=3120356 RepID=UPI002FCDEE83
MIANKTRSTYEEIPGMRLLLAFTLMALFVAAQVPANARAGDASLLDRVYGQPHDSKVWMSEITSQTLLRMGHVDFPLSVDLDLAVEAERAELGQILDFDAPGPRFAFIFDVQQAKARRRVVNLKGVPSTVFLGYGGKALSVAPDDPISSLSEVQRLSSNRNLAQSYLNQSGLNKSGGLGEPILLSYEYDKAQIHATRAMSVTTYVIDRHKRTYVKSNFDITDDRRFEVAYRVSSYDPRRETIRNTNDSEEDVDDFEKDSLDVKLSSLFKDYLTKRSQAVAINNPVALRKAWMKDRNINLANVNANTFDDRPLNDPRFDSVVAIYTGAGSLGTGFYVTPTVVMTNWHVVEDHPFVEMKTYDGRETFGTVLGKDALLDVALVKVELRGRPVAFYTGKSVDVGHSVEAIGHPRRMEFSITRGVVSAIRRHYSINLPYGAGDKVLYIQTDAPINPGNSGGPLFLGNRVVGMNTWGRNDGEGLNFSVHYSQLMNFMNDHLAGYSVSPAGPKKEVKR